MIWSLLVKILLQKSEIFLVNIGYFAWNYEDLIKLKSLNILCEQSFSTKYQLLTVVHQNRVVPGSALNSTLQGGNSCLKFFSSSNCLRPKIATKSYVSQTFQQRRPLSRPQKPKNSNKIFFFLTHRTELSYQSAKNIRSVRRFPHRSCVKRNKKRSFMRTNPYSVRCGRSCPKIMAKTKKGEDEISSKTHRPINRPTKS